jgi:di/tricarboxylate transporter
MDASLTHAWPDLATKLIHCLTLCCRPVAPKCVCPADLWPCSVLTACLMLLTGCLSGDDARRSILWEVYLCIAAAFGVSNAMEGTGVAREFAQVFITIAEKIGSEGAGLTAIYIATALLSEILTNNAAAAIMYPIAAVAGDSLGIEPRKMSTAIMLGASAGFVNPFSYQTNLMVSARPGLASS